jgi:hypothetical protein
MNNLESQHKKSQIKANKVRIIIGVISMLVAWGLFIYKGLLHDLYLVLLGAFTLYTVFAYIIVPINKNKKLKDSMHEE